MNLINMSRVWRKPARLFVFLAMLLSPGLAWSLEVPPLTGRVMDLAPVSYTHLDVYKRQGEDTGRDMEGGGVSVDRLRNLAISLTERQTHL